MATNYSYTLSLIDKVSPQLKDISGASVHVASKIEGLISSQNKFQSVNHSLGGSLAALRAKLDMLKAEKELISPRSVASIKTYNKNIDKLTKQLTELDNVGRGNGLGILNFSAGIQKAQGVAEGLTQAIAPAIGFNQSMADLSAITGIAGKDLERLGATARRTGKDSGLGAGQGAEAFKLLASQIDVAKIGINGLEELQKRSITLAQASGMTMDESANALAGTINQFGLEANEANRIINVLAAGSKYGAAEIPELAQSFKVVGAAANAAGLSVESTAGAIEVLSKNNLKGAEAGTALRNIMLKMQTVLGYDFRETSLSSALDDLKPKLTDATYLSKIFGMENIAAAQFLISNSSAVEEMTAKVTGSNVAQEQAAIRTETWQHKMAVARAWVDNLKISVAEYTGFAIPLISVVAEQGVVVAQLLPLIKLLGSGVMITGKSFLHLFTAEEAGKKIRLLTYAQTAYSYLFKGGLVKSVKDFGKMIKSLTLSTKLASGGQWLLNVATGAYSFLFKGGLVKSVRDFGKLIKSMELSTKLASAGQWLLNVATGAYSFLFKGGLVASMMNFWKVIKSSALFTKLAAAGQWLLNSSLFACPIVWIVAGVAALVAGFVLLWNKCEGFRKVLLGTWEVMKAFGAMIWDVVVGAFSKMFESLGLLGGAIMDLFAGNFEEAGRKAKEGFKLGFESSPIGMVIDTVTKFTDTNFSEAYDKGAAKGVRADVDNEKEFGVSNIPKIPYSPIISNSNTESDIPQFGFSQFGLSKSGIPIVPQTITQATFVAPEIPTIQTVLNNPIIPTDNKESVIPQFEMPVVTQTIVPFITPEILTIPTIPMVLNNSIIPTDNKESVMPWFEIPVVTEVFTPFVAPVIPPLAIVDEMPKVDSMQNSMHGTANNTYNSQSSEARTTKIDRICNDIIINIKDTSGKSIAEIKRVILDELELIIA